MGQSPPKYFYHCMILIRFDLPVSWEVLKLFFLKLLKRSYHTLHVLLAHVWTLVLLGQSQSMTEKGSSLTSALNHPKPSGWKKKLDTWKWNTTYKVVMLKKGKKREECNNQHFFTYFCHSHKWSTKLGMTRKLSKPDLPELLLLLFRHFS